MGGPRGTHNCGTCVGRAADKCPYWSGHWHCSARPFAVGFDGMDWPRRLVSGEFWVAVAAGRRVSSDRWVAFLAYTLISPSLFSH